MRKQTLSQLKKKAWNLLSKCIRKEAADHSGRVWCYTCSWSGMWTASQAGHAIGGRTGAVLFDESIIRVQCVKCNIFERGNYGVFALRLIQENGAEWYAKKQFEARKTVKLSRVDCLSRIEEYKARLAKL